MKTIALLAASLLPLALAAQAPAPAPKSELAPFRWFADLAGACWRGEHPDGKTGDIQCYSTQYGRFVRGTIKVYKQPDPNAVVFEGDSVFGWDAKGSRMVYTQWASNGSITPAQEAHWDGEILRFGARDAKDATVRSSWQKEGKDGFKVVRERKEGPLWKEVFAVTYRRAP